MVKTWREDGHGGPGEAPHASHLVLDRLLLGIEPGARVQAHVARCARCAQQLERARERQHALAAAQHPLPDWALSLAAETPAPSTRDVAVPAPPARERHVRWLGLGLGAASCAALLVLLQIGLPRTPHERAAEPVLTPGSSGVTAKGGPDVGVYVKRGERVFLWDGSQSVLEGDRLRLRISAERYTFVAVAARLKTGLATLYRAELRGASELPVAWAVDGEGDSEQLLVVLSRQPVSDALLAEWGRAGPTPRDTWSRELVLPKAHGSQP